MTTEELEIKWKSLRPESTGSFKSLRISADCFPDLYVGLDASGIRCLILKLPAGHVLDFQSILRQNLSIELFRETHWIVLKLTNALYADLFNDLILSLYNKIKGIQSVSDYTALFIETFYKWSEFFEDNASGRLSDETVKGIFGELIFLRELIPQGNVATINDVLLGWQGLYDTGHDFIFQDHNTEVKTKEQSALDIHISSEYQLEPESAKPLRLAVVNVLKDNLGITLRDVVMQIRGLITQRLGDFTIILKAMNQKGLTLANVGEYDNLRFVPLDITMYDCMDEAFPKIVRAELPPLINSVRYHLRIASLDTFITEKRSLNGA